jgi:hypothetical protein
MSTFIKFGFLVLCLLVSGSFARASEYSGVGFGPDAKARHPIVNLEALSGLRGFDAKGACGFLVPPAGKQVGSFHVLKQSPCTSSTPKFVQAERMFHGGFTFSEFKKKSDQERASISADVYAKSLKVYLNPKESGSLVDVFLHVDRLVDGVPGLKADSPDVVYAVYQLPNFGKRMKVPIGEVIGSVSSGFRLLSLCQGAAKASSEYSKSCTLSVSSKGSLDVTMREHSQQELAEADLSLPKR